MGENSERRSRRELELEAEIAGLRRLLDQRSAEQEELVARRAEAQSEAAESAAALAALRRDSAELLRREEFTRCILDSAVDYGIVATDVNGRLLSWNEGACRIMGWTEAEVIGRWLGFFFTPEQVAMGAPEAEMQQALLNGRAEDERWHVRKDGSRFWANGLLMLLKTEGGQHLGFIKILRDRTDQRRHAQALRESQESLELALAASGVVGVWDWDVQDDRLRADERFARLFAVAPERAAAGVPLAEFMSAIHPDDLERVEAALRECCAAGGDYADEYRVVQADGSLRWVLTRGRCYRDEQGRPGRYPGVAVDITERKRTEDALRTAEASIRIALDAAKLGRWDYEPPLGRRYWDARCRSIFGLPVEGEIDLAAMLAPIHPDDLARVTAAVQAALDPQRPGEMQIEYRIRRADDGEERWIESVGRGVMESGRCTRFVGVLQDVTERKQGEQHLQLLVNELNHRVKNSLAMVQALAAQTFRNAESVAQARDAFTTRLSALAKAHDLLTEGLWQGADLREVLARTTASHVGAEEGRFSLHGPRLHILPKAALSVAMAMNELATNAVKYGALSTPSGRVEISWRIADGGGTERFVLCWRESDGPAVQPPTRQGFGSRLIRHGLTGSPQERVACDYAASGVVCTFDAPLAGISGGAEPVPS